KTVEAWRQELDVAVHGTRPGWLRRAFVAGMAIAALVILFLTLFRPLAGPTHLDSIAAHPAPALSIGRFLGEHLNGHEALLVACNRNGGSNIYHIKPDGGDLGSLTQDQEQNGDPTLSPDGYRL